MSISVAPGGWFGEGSRIGSGKGRNPQGDRPMPLNKKTNEYAEMITPELYASCPKSVFAALAASPQVNQGADIRAEDSVDRYLAREWDLLHTNGLIPQPLPQRFRHLIEN
jgi:hypothetical protein